MEWNILYEDEYIIVVKKPAGIAVQTKRIGEQDMVSLLRNHIKKPYLAVIHRLDQPVEGILVFAKTPFAAKELNRQLQTKGFGKYYKALLAGIPKEEEGTLVDYLIRDGKTNMSRVGKKEEKDAKEAVLSYKILKKNEEAGTALVQIRLETGRHHQIRVQTAHMGCPIVGDRKYNPNSGEDKKAPLSLCAYKLEITHPKTKKKMCFETEASWE